MSNTHFSGERKQHANTVDAGFKHIYEDYWGDEIRYHNHQEGTHYPDSIADMTDAQVHDIIGADRLILRDSPAGVVPVFVEEKSRTFKREKLDREFYDRPFDEDLALTIEYHNKSNQPKHRKHLEHREGHIFTPSILSYLIYDPETKQPIRGYLIDYEKLLATKSDMEYETYRNDIDGNTSHYITQLELVERGLVIHSWQNDGWEQ